MRVGLITWCQEWDTNARKNMSRFNPPKELSHEGSLSVEWGRWKKEFKFYLTATESSEKDEDVKTSRLLTAIGEKARDINYTFTFEEEDEMKLAPVMTKFDEYITPKKNLPYLRFKFFSYNQTDGQTIDEYVTELKSRSRHFEFDSLKDGLIRDKIAAGIQDSKVRERLLREPDKDKAMAICREAEVTKKQTNEKKTNVIVEIVDAVSFGHRDKRQPTLPESKPNSLRLPRNRRRPKMCKYFGYSHEREKCPAYGKVCNKCRKWSHFARVCQSKAINNV